MISGRGLRKFIRVLAWRPARVPAILWWYVTRRRVRARERLKAAFAGLPLAYQYWIADCARADRAVLTQARPAPWREHRFAIHLHYQGDTDERAFGEAIASIMRQSWRDWRVLVTAAGISPRLPNDSRISVVEGRFSSREQGLSTTVALTQSCYLLPLRGDCTLPRHALRAYAAALRSEPADDKPILYGDQDEILSRRAGGQPWLKPDWDPDMILSQDYVSTACLLPVAAARRALDIVPFSDGNDVYTLLLRMTRQLGCRMKHVARVTVSTPTGAWRTPCPSPCAAVGAILAEEDAEGRAIEVRPGPFGTTEVIWPLPQDVPLVSIIIPTRDKVELLRPCVEGVLANTSYPRLEVIIADNGSVEPATHHFLKAVVVDPRVTLVSWPHAYNYSGINNFAADFAHGDYLCLLNNDIEIIDPNWLTAMMRHAVRPGIGAVGARLLYPDHSIQHAGVVIGLGNAAGHAHRGQPDGDAGYFANALIARRVCAVTAACLVVARRKFDDVGRLDAENLAIAYNDVDLCLKLRRAGWHNIYVPQAVLIHHESKSRGSDFAADHHLRYLRELAVLQKRWGTRLFQDPAHHPALDRSSETFRPSYDRV